LKVLKDDIYEHPANAMLQK